MTSCKDYNNDDTLDICESVFESATSKYQMSSTYPYSLMVSVNYPEGYKKDFCYSCIITPSDGGAPILFHSGILYLWGVPDCSAALILNPSFIST